MILKNYKNHFHQTLVELYPQTEIDTFFFLLIEEYLDFKRIDVILNSDFEIPKEKFKLLETALKRLQKEEPLQYIIGKTEFYGFPFFVNKNVLIPRPETEELVEWIINKAKESKTQNISILDIGTGSGCIPISIIKQVKNSSVTAIDVSKEALNIANKNAQLNEVNINFIALDILNTSQLDQKYDIIISNPPYVRELEKKEINNNVLQNEPHLALFVEDDDPLIFYDKIAELAKNHFTKNGMLFFEINQYLGKETVELLETKGFKNIELKKDLFGNDRMILAYN